MISLIFLSSALIVGHPPQSSAFVNQAKVACRAAVGQNPGVDGIRIANVAAQDRDLPFLRITDERSGGWMKLYYDPTSQRAAIARAACLGAQLRLLQAEIGGVWPNNQWSSVVMTTNASYTTPAGETITRWHVRTLPDGTLDEMAQKIIVITMPHEQVHRFQSRAGSVTPRWFHEGHAEWIGLKISTVIAPADARQREVEQAAALRSSTSPVALLQWGGIRVKRAAIMRQVTDIERGKMEADPKYNPPRSGQALVFGPNDLINDDGNEPARYQAAWQVFRDLETAHGKIKINQWVEEITLRAGRPDMSAIVATAKADLGDDLVKRLRSADSR